MSHVCLFFFGLLETIFQQIWENSAMQEWEVGEIWKIQPDFDWAIYSDLSQEHPKWWFRKGIPSKMALNQVKDLE